jgi:hypothetical protein
VKYTITGPYYSSLALSIFLHIKARSFGMPLQFDVDVGSNSSDFGNAKLNLEGGVLAYHPPLAGILSDCDSQIPEVFFSSPRVSQPLLLLTTYPLIINRNGLGESDVTQELISLYRKINTPIAKVLQNILHQLQSMSIPSEPFAIDILLDSKIPIEWRLSFLQSCGRLFLHTSHRVLALQDIFDFQFHNFVNIAQSIDLQYLMKHGIDDSIKNIFTTTFQNDIQNFFQLISSGVSKQSQQSIYQLIVDVLQSPICPHLGPIPKKDQYLSKYLYECISGKPKNVKNITNLKTELEEQFAFMGGKLIKEDSRQQIDGVVKSDQIIVFSPFGKKEEDQNRTTNNEPWSLFLEEIDRAFEKSEEIWKDILHPSY